MGNVRYEEVQCRQALNRVEGMGFRWSLNPYRGCVHGCQYCFARRYHGFLELNASEDFTDIIFVKVNCPDVLRRELSRPSWRGDAVAMGTATDPYQPIEGRYRLTRRCLEALTLKRTPVSVVTKRTMIVRDRDVLTDAARRAGCTVCFSVTTLDPDPWRSLEPGTPPPLQRLRAMGRLVQAGVKAGVLLAPIIPGITDGRDNLEAVVRAAAEQGACFLGANVLHLKPGTREHFMGFLDREHPDLLPAYQRLYPGSYTPKRFHETLQSQVRALKLLHRLGERPSPVIQPEERPRQMTLGI